jgi:hypothetical protein
MVPARIPQICIESLNFEEVRSELGDLGIYPDADIRADIMRETGPGTLFPRIELGVQTLHHRHSSVRGPASTGAV